MQHKNLFSQLKLRDVTLPNRIAVSPMCQYSAVDGVVNDWHFVHLATRAVGGAGLVLTEASAVTPEGRISPRDLGIWSDEHVAGLKRTVEFMHAQGAATGIQLAHAGRKSSMAPPWEPTRVVPPEEGGWTNIVAPSPIAFSEHYGVPEELTITQIHGLTKAFVTATKRAVSAGFDVIELHGAHGYLFHQFLSPLSNQRTDHYGGSFENRCRFLLETVRAVQDVLPASHPLLVRISATDWLEYDEAYAPAEKGWTLDQSVELSRLLRAEGVDLVDVSTGGNVARSTIPVGPGYQTGFAAAIRERVDVATGAVGMISTPEQADHIIRSEQADLVLLARELLRDPYWPMRAAQQLRHDVPWPVQYVRAAGGHKPVRVPMHGWPSA